MGKQKGGLDCSGGEDEGSLGRQGGGEMQALERYELADGGRESLELGSDGQSGDGWGAMALDLGCRWSRSNGDRLQVRRPLGRGRCHGWWLCESSGSGC